MKVSITFFKNTTGKCYSSCEVDIPDSELGFPGSNEAIFAIVNYQTALVDGWQGKYCVVTQELEDNAWWTHLYQAERFAKIGKSNLKG